MDLFLLGPIIKEIGILKMFQETIVKKLGTYLKIFPEHIIIVEL